MNPTYRQRIAALIQSSAALRPTHLQLGTGGFDNATNAPRTPIGTLYAPLAGLHPVAPILGADGATIHITVALAPGSTPLEFSEAVLLTADGTPIMHACTLPQAVASGVDALFNFALNGPLVTDAALGEEAIDFLSLYEASAL